MAMKPWSMTNVSLLLPLLLLLLPHHLRLASTAADSVEATCKTIARDDPNVHYAFCVEALRRDPASGAADTKGLAVIAAKLSEKNATSMVAAATALLGKARRPPERRSLETCASAYGEAVEALGLSVGAIEEGRLDDAMTYLSASIGAADVCAQAFEELRVACPFPKQNMAAQQFCYVALCITHLLG
ncbi:putative invertase inhibitor [Zingiber officinale]|uniref:putative invertase inhibitor n=1 Tax=Zingiber officinale TaxID=94328 RepID=UPI001C4ADAE0|nr:putative invertase inhibitor [Zingiber officinale]